MRQGLDGQLVAQIIEKHDVDMEFMLCFLRRLRRKLQECQNPNGLTGGEIAELEAELTEFEAQI